MKIIIIGIHTGIGKTIASAVVCQALRADYWKPVQAGNLEETDSDRVRKLVSNAETVIHPEAYRFTEAMSPHAAAQIDKNQIAFDRLILPETKNNLFIESAGGLLSPLTEERTNLDMVLHFNVPVLLVSQNYLGSINHTLLTIEVLRKNNVSVKGIIFNGYENKDSERYIKNYTQFPVVISIPQLSDLTAQSVEAMAVQLLPELKAVLK